MQKKKDCPCCGAAEVIEENFDICPVCGWEYDPVQNEDPDFEGGANKDSLNQHKIKYLKDVGLEKLVGIFTNAATKTTTKKTTTKSNTKKATTKKKTTSKKTTTKKATTKKTTTKKTTTKKPTTKKSTTKKTSKTTTSKVNSTIKKAGTKLVGKLLKNFLG